MFVENLLLAFTEAHVGLGLSFNILGPDTDIETLFVEVTCSFKILQIFKFIGNACVHLKAFLSVVMSHIFFGGFQILTQI